LRYPPRDCGAGGGMESCGAAPGVPRGGGAAVC